MSKILYTNVMKKNILRTLVFQVIAVILVIGVAFYFADLARGNESVQHMVSTYGFVGIFLVSVVSGFNFVIPIPAISFLPLFLESGLDYWSTIVVISMGMTTADSIAYALGNVGKKVVRGKIVEKLEKKIKILHEKYAWAPLVVLFIFATVAPLPNEVLLIPFAFLNYKFRYIIPIVLVGNIVFNVLYSQGVLSLFYLW